MSHEPLYLPFLFILSFLCVVVRGILSLLEDPFPIFPSYLHPIQLDHHLLFS